MKSREAWESRTEWKSAWRRRIKKNLVTLDVTSAWKCRNAPKVKGSIEEEEIIESEGKH